MSSPIGELPVRRHLLPEVAALLLQAAAGARRRALRRQVLLRERPGQPDLSAFAPAVMAAGEAAQRAPGQELPEPKVTVGQAPPGPAAAGAGAPGPLPSSRARPLEPVRLTESAVHRPGAAAPVPAMARLLQAAALQAERARALEQEALMAALPAAGRRPGLAIAPPVQGADAPLPGTAPAATENGSLLPPGVNRIRPLPPLAGLRTGYAHPEAAAAGPMLAPATPAVRPQGPSYTDGSPFGPHPIPPGPVIGAPADRVTPTGPPVPAYPESELLMEERLREHLARILRADGLRHGLDLKER